MSRLVVVMCSSSRWDLNTEERKQVRVPAVGSPLSLCFITSSVLAPSGSRPGTIDRDWHITHTKIIPLNNCHTAKSCLIWPGGVVAHASQSMSVFILPFNQTSVSIYIANYRTILLGEEARVRILHRPILFFASLSP